MSSFDPLRIVDFALTDKIACKPNSVNVSPSDKQKGLLLCYLRIIFIALGDNNKD